MGSACFQQHHMLFYTVRIITCPLEATWSGLYCFPQHHMLFYTVRIITCPLEATWSGLYCFPQHHMFFYTVRIITCPLEATWSGLYCFPQHHMLFYTVRIITCPLEATWSGFPVLIPVNQPTIKEQVQHMNRPCLGTHLEIKAAATLFQLPIDFCAWSEQRSSFTPNNMTFPELVDEYLKRNKISVSLKCTIIEVTVKQLYNGE